MDKDQIRKLLQSLDISQADQFKEGDLIYWWQKKYMNLKKNFQNAELNNFLVEINNAKDILENIDLEIIKETLSNNASEEKPKLNYLEIGYEKYELGEYGNAIEIFSEAISIDYQNPEYHAMRGLSYFASEKYFEAEIDLSSSIKFGYENIINCFNIRGQCYLKLERINEAIQDFNTAISIDKEDSDNYEFLGLCFIELYKWEKALGYLDNAISLNNKSSNAFTLRGTCFHYLRNNEKAIEDLTKAISLKDNDAQNFFLRGSFYFEIKKYNAAIKDFTLAISINDKESIYFNFRGKCHFELQEYDNALKDFDRELQRYIAYIRDYEQESSNDPYLIEEDDEIDSEIFYWRGKCYKNQKKYKDAIKEFTTAINNDEINFYTYKYLFERASCKYFLNDIDGALEDLESSKKLIYEQEHQIEDEEEEELIKNIINLNKKILDNKTNLIEKNEEGNKEQINLIEEDVEDENKEQINLKKYRKNKLAFLQILSIFFIALVVIIASEIPKMKNANQNMFNKSGSQTKWSPLKCKGCDKWTYLQKGNENYKRNDFPLAIKYYELAINESYGKEFYQAQLNKTYAQEKIGDFSGALKTIQEINRVYSYNLRHLKITGRLQTKLGYFQEAIQTNLRIIELSEKDNKTKGITFSYLGDLEFKLGNKENACKYWRKSRRVLRKQKNDEFVRKIRKENLTKIREYCELSTGVKIRKFFLW